jgi:hypothetical protein
MQQPFGDVNAGAGRRFLIVERICAAMFESVSTKRKAAAIDVFDLHCRPSTKLFRARNNGGSPLEHCGETSRDLHNASAPNRETPGSGIGIEAEKPSHSKPISGSPTPIPQFHRSPSASDAVPLPADMLKDGAGVLFYCGQVLCGRVMLRPGHLRPGHPRPGHPRQSRRRPSRSPITPLG